MLSEKLEIFSECRLLLLSLARRILGSENEAEDMVQEAYLRWDKTDLRQVRSPKAFLTTTITRLCLNQLQLGRVRLRQDEPDGIGDEVPAAAPGPDQNAELADALTQAFARMLATLSPTETAVFLLREAFDFDYSDIAPIVERSEANCRQILKRARERLQRSQAPDGTNSKRNQRMVQVFRQAVTTGELESLLDALSEDAVLVRDGGDLSQPAPPPVLGAAVRTVLREAIGRIMAGSARILCSEPLSGKHLLVAERGGQASGALLFQVRQGRIKSINLVTCPAMLRHLRIFAQLSGAHLDNDSQPQH